MQRREVTRLADSIGLQPHTTVAVIVPTYRRQAELCKAVESILSQSFTDFRVYVVDDGGDQVDTLPHDSRVVAVRLARNSANLGMVRNVGIDLSRSTYVAFLDDDNTWSTNHLSATINHLENSAAGLVYTAVDRYGPEGLIDTLSNEFDWQTFRDGNSYIDANSLVCRRVRNTRFSLLPRRKTTLPKEDWRFVFDMRRRYPVEHLAVRTVAYYINPDSYYTDWNRG